jgi:hypothetical protein
MAHGAEALFGRFGITRASASVFDLTIMIHLSIKPQAQTFTDLGWQSGGKLWVNGPD